MMSDRISLFRVAPYHPKERSALNLLWVAFKEPSPKAPEYPEVRKSIRLPGTSAKLVKFITLDRYLAC